MRVVVGRIGRAHGIRGEVTVEPRTDEPELRFADGAALMIEGSDRVLFVERMHWHSGRLLISFDGVDDRNAAEALRGSLLEVERADDESPDDPEEFYDSQLIGCAAVVDGEPVGEVTDVIHLPAQDLLAVHLSGTDATVADVLVPFVQAFVPTVDVTARRVVLTPPPGLLDSPDADDESDTPDPS